MNFTPISLTDAARDVVAHINDSKICYPWAIGAGGLGADLTTGPGHYVVVAAKTGVGKSAFALQVATGMARAGLETAIVSLEMDSKSLCQRYLAQSAGMACIRHGDATDAQLDQMRALLQRDNGLPLRLINGAGCSVADIADYIRENPATKVVIVDYIQLMRGAGSNTVDQLRNISVGLATLAHSTGVCIIALAQALIKGADAMNPNPGLEAVQGSSQMAQDADALILLYREHDGDADSRRVIKVAKNRHGAAGWSIFMDFDGCRQRFSPSDDQNPSRPEKNRFTFDKKS